MLTGQKIAVPRLRNPVLLSRREWYQKYEYFIECIWNCVVNYVMTSTQGAYIVNQDELRDILVDYLYDTSANKFRNYDLLK
jgi:hypothetical protein